MSAREFLAAVLPSHGYYCVAEFTTPAKEHVFVQSVDDMLPVIERLHKAKLDTYFALSAFGTPDNRTQKNATTIRAAFLDIEGASDSHYKSKAEVAAAVDAFLDASGLGVLGLPWVVSSGGGLHFYWPFTKDIPIKVWRPVAESFKRLCKKHKLEIDWHVTADSARVLRVPGTTNWKEKYPKPRPCELKIKGDVFDFDAFAEAVRMPLNGEALHEPDNDLPGTPPAPGTAMLKLIENSESNFRLILEKGCKQIEHYFTHATDDGMEPLWRGILSISQLCTDADKAAKKLSAMHPYTHERLQEKLRGLKGVGPHTCTAFDSLNPGPCDTCDHKGKITTPLQLGRVLRTETTAKPITIANLASAETITVQRPEPPHGFYYGKAGGIIADVLTGTGKNEKTEKKQILAYDLFPVDILKNSTGHFLHMKAMRHEGVEDIVIPTMLITSKERVLEAITRQNIIPSMFNASHVHKYINLACEELSASRAPTLVPESYGWQKDFSFVYNGTVFLPDGKELILPMPGLDNLLNSTGSEGTLSRWVEAMNLLITKRFDDVLAMAVFGFAAPLMTFKDLCGLVVHISSMESGTGKSLALEMAASIWGDPRRFKVNKRTSDVALENHLGLLRSLPLCVDEITSKADPSRMANNKDLEWFPDFLLAISDGHGKDRMESGANKERVNTTQWSTLSIMTSNVNMLGYLTSSRKHSSQGQLRRLLEQVLPQKLIKSVAEEQTMNLRYHNYGIAGRKYVQWLVRNRVQAEDMTLKMFEAVRNDLSSDSEERYWTMGVAAAITGSIIAGPKYAGIMELPIPRIRNSLYSLVKYMRSAVEKASAERTAVQVLHTFIADNANFFFTAHQTGTQVTTNEITFSSDPSSARSKIVGRAESGVVQGKLLIFIPLHRVKDLCVSVGYRFDAFEKELRKTYPVRYVQKHMMAGRKNGDLGIRFDCLEITMPDDASVSVGQTRE